MKVCLFLVLVTGTFMKRKNLMITHNIMFLLCLLLFSNIDPIFAVLYRTLSMDCSYIL